MQALMISAVLGAAVSWVVAQAASASSGPNPPPMTGPITDPLPPGGTSPNPPPMTGPITDPLPPGGTNPPAGVARCSEGQLRLKFVGMQGATGHRYVDYAFRNAGAGSCSLRGYPRANLANQSGQAMRGSREKVGHWRISPIRTVVIQPGKRAFFTFMWVDGGFCPGNSFSFYGLRVAPPKDLNAFSRHYGNTPACGSSAMVSAVRPKLVGF